MENRILIQLSLNEEEKPMYSWKTRMAKTAAAVLAGTLALSGCGVGTGTTNAKGGSLRRGHHHRAGGVQQP